MITGTRTTNRNLEEAKDRLRTILAGANCEVTSSGENEIRFNHGTFFTESAPLLPKEGFVRLTSEGEGTRMDYGISLKLFPALWISTFGVLFCWLIFPAVVAYRAVQVHPRLMMENLLADV